MFCYFQKISSGFSWSPADHSEARNQSTEKDKIKKLDSEFKPPASQQQENNVTLSPISASNLETMPVGSGVQGQNPTQGQTYIDVFLFCLLTDYIFRTCALDERSDG
jgi:hypothetical protein